MVRSKTKKPKNPYVVIKTKDKIVGPYWLDAQIKMPNTEEPSRIFCDKIEYLHNRGKMGFSEIFDHHLMFWQGKKLVFKVWLPNSEKDREFNDIDEAMASVGMKLINANQKE
ncbi:Uncharacterised protein [uncultured archaeon]|nr:Uncharacterised protein [uncultured archaeon]